MVGTELRQWRRLVERDLRIVKQGARFIMKIDEERVKVTENQNWQLNLIVIIGQGLVPLGDYPQTKEALLCEIGLWRSRPHRNTHEIRARRKFFELTEDQYRLVAPVVFAKLFELANTTVASWENQTFAIPHPHHYYKRKPGELETSTKYKEVLRGVKFSFDRRDERFIQDICWGEMNGNDNLKSHLKGLARLIAMNLKPYRGDGRSMKQFEKLKGAKPVIRVLRAKKLHLHLLAELISRYLPDGVNYPHAHLLAEVIGWDMIPTRFQQKAKQALPGVKERLAGIQLRIDHQKNGYLVIEITPPITAEEKTPQGPESAGIVEDDDEEDDFPF